MKTRKVKFELNSLKVVMMFLFIAVLFFSCRNSGNNENDTDDFNTQQTTTDTVATPVEVRAYTGKINAVKNSGEEISGEIAVRVEGDLARFHISAEGLAPEMMHIQYLLVSQTGNQTDCPGDVEEMGTNENNTTVQDDGLSRIPIHAGTTTMDLDVDTYPRTNANGELEFTRTVSLDSVRTAVSSEFAMPQDLDFTKVTFVVRGIPDAESDPGPNRGTSGLENITVGCARLQETTVRD